MRARQALDVLGDRYVAEICDVAAGIVDVLAARDGRLLAHGAIVVSVPAVLPPSSPRPRAANASPVAWA